MVAACVKLPGRTEIRMLLLLLLQMPLTSTAGRRSVGRSYLHARVCVAVCLPVCVGGRTLVGCSMLTESLARHGTGSLVCWTCGLGNGRALFL